MKKFSILLKYESHKLIVSPSTYILSLIFMLSVAAIFLSLLWEYSAAEQDVPFAQSFFRYCWLSCCAAIALITMRSFPDEYKSGTLQSLFSVRVSSYSVVLAKFCTTYVWFMVLWLCASSMFAIALSGNLIPYEAAFASEYSIAGGLLFTALTSLFFVAIGIFASSLTENQVVASVLTLCILISIFIVGHIWCQRSQIVNLTPFGAYSESLSIFAQLDNFCNGIFDSRVAVFYLSSCFLTLYLSAFAVQRRLS
jgi:ABC-2 type transport system permease protein